MSDRKDIERRVNIIVFACFIMLALVPLAIYLLRAPIGRMKDVARLYEADGPGRPEAAAGIVEKHEFETLPAAFFAYCESADNSVVEPISDMFDRVTRNRTAAEGLEFYRDIAEDIPEDDEYPRRLEKAFRDTKSPDRRMRALTGLAMMKNADSLGALARAAGDPDKGVRYRGVFLLSHRSSADAVPVLLEYLDDKVVLIRETAERTLREKWKKEAGLLLVRMLKHSDPRVRSEAAARLMTIFEKNLGFEPKGSEKSRSEAIKKWTKEIHGLDK